MIDFPRVGFVQSVVALDTYIQITTQAATPTHRFTAVIHIGLTNYRVMPGDVINWGDERVIVWIPCAGGMAIGREKKLWLVRILTQEVYPLL